MEFKPWLDLQEMLPELSGGEKSALKISIRDHGVLENGVAWKVDDKLCLILDGVHRYDYSNGDMNFKILEDIDKETAISIGIALNVARRNLSPEQVQVLQEKLQANKKEQKLTALHLRAQGKTQTEVSAIIGIPRQTLSDWEQNVSNADFGNTYIPEVRDLRISVPKSEYDTLYGRYLGGETQKEIADDLKISRPRVSQIIKTVKKEINSKAKEEEEKDKRLRFEVKAKIKKQDAIEFLEEFGEKSVDLLITDPLYSTDVDDIEDYVDSWFYSALSIVKDSGQIYVFIGSYAWELRAYLNALKKVEDRFGQPQILVWTYKNTLGPPTKTQYKQNWQAILYLRGPEAFELNSDRLLDKFSVQEFNAPDGRNGTRYHEWQKPIALAKRLVSHSSKENSIIIDPFAGTGTFLLAASELGRQNIGCEIDDEMISIALERGCVLA